MSWRFLSRALLTASIALASGVAVSADREWLPLANGSLEIREGTALDFGRLPITRFSPGRGTVKVTVPDGRFVLEGPAGREELRFLCATLGLGPNTGGFPTHGESDRLATLLRRQGYNAVRVHMAEAMLMAYRSEDFSFDPEELDRLYYLLAALRKQGMFLFVDMLGSWNGAFGDVRPHRWVRGKHDVVLGSLLPGPDREHWLDLVKRLWASRNPYTGQSTLTDTAVAGVVLVNEGGTDFLLRREPSRVLLPTFQEWLIKRHGSEATARQAIGDWPTATNLPRVQDSSFLAAEFQRFAAELQDRQVIWMRQQLRSLGYRGAVTAFNAGVGVHALRGQRELDFIDMHAYADHPTQGFIEPGARIDGGRLLDGRNRYFDFLAWSRSWGRPFTATEFGQPFWNPWRWEVAPFTAAYARLQGWSLIGHFGDTFNLSRPGKGRWRQMIVPFDVGTDPTLRAGEVVSALLYGRGDVSPSRTSITLQVPPALAEAAPAGTFVNWTTAQMQYVVAVGKELQEWRGVTPGTRVSLSWAEDGVGAPELAQRLHRLGALEKDVADSVKGGRYLSSTKEIFLDTKRMVMTVSTPRSVGVLGSAGAVVQGPVRIEIAEGHAAAFASALDSQDLARTGRALMVISTDSRNSGMKFRDPEERVIERLGHLPVLVRDATVKVTMPAHHSGQRWILWALAPTGERRVSLPLSRLADGSASASIRLSDLGEAVTPYFEWTVE